MRVFWPLAASLALHAAVLALLPATSAPVTPPSLTLALLPATAATSPARSPRSAGTGRPPAPAPTPARAQTATPPALAARAATHRTPAASNPSAPRTPAVAPPLAPDLGARPDAPAQAKAGGTVRGLAAADAVVAAAGTPHGADTATPAAGDGGAFSSADWRAGYLRNPPPVYPERSRERGEQGRVLLRVTVGTDGRVRAVQLVQSSGFARLDRAARDAVLGWRFTPARRGERALEDTVDVPIRFNQVDP